MISFIEVLPAEAPFLSEMRRLVWLSAYRGIYPDEMLDDFDFAFHNEKNLSMIKSPDYHVYFIVDNGTKAGYLILHNKKTLRVQSLCLLENFRRKGIGRKAFEFIKDSCRKNGSGKFYLSCHPENKAGLAFYEKMGGKITERSENHKNNEENSIKFEFIT